MGKLVVDVEIYLEGDSGGAISGSGSSVRELPEGRYLAPGLANEVVLAALREALMEFEAEIERQSMEG